MLKTRRVAVAIDLSIPMRHHHDVFAGIQRYAKEHAEWECVVQPFVGALQNSPDKEGYRGIIARATAALAIQAAKAGVPVVNVWSGSPAKTLPSVLPDFEACGRMAAEHLLQRGFRRFAFQGLLRHKGSAQALAGFETAIRAACVKSVKQGAGLLCRTSSKGALHTLGQSSCSRSKCRTSTLIISPRSDENVRSWSRYLVQLEHWISGWKPPLGVFVVQDVFCRYVANICLQAGFRIPEDVALIGLGNEPLICTHIEPSLSSFDLGFDRVGYEAALLLDRLMDGAPSPQMPILIEPTELVVRRSTDVYLVDNPRVAAALRFIAENGHNCIHVDDVAQHVHTTVRTLERHFRETTGRTMTEEITRLRLERAKRLLVQSDEPIKQVASDCGFSDATYFHRVFLQAEKMSPGEFRRQRSSIRIK